MGSRELSWIPGRAYYVTEEGREVARANVEEPNGEDR